MFEFTDEPMKVFDRRFSANTMTFDAISLGSKFGDEFVEEIHDSHFSKTPSEEGWLVLKRNIRFKYFIKSGAVVGVEIEALCNPRLKKITKSHLIKVLGMPSRIEPVTITYVWDVVFLHEVHRYDDLSLGFTFLEDDEFLSTIEVGEVPQI